MNSQNYKKCSYCSGELIGKNVVHSNGKKHIKLICKECGIWNGFAKSVETKDFIMPFGKYKGQKISELPTDYIHWCMENLSNNNIKTRMEEIYETREDT